VPSAAARLADVGAADPHPLELGRRIEHFLQQLTVLILDQHSIAKSGAGFGDAVGETIANGLQLPEVKYPWNGRTSVTLNAMRDLGVAEGFAEERGQLRLQARDLTAQLEPSLALVDSAPEPGELLTFQQSGHQGKV
jgi:hypothetical protein